MKIRLATAIISIGMICILAPSAIAQDEIPTDYLRAMDRADLNWIGGGVRARSMGGAFVSLADDASAITWNPAGLIQTLDPQMSFSGTFVRPRSRYDVNYLLPYGGQYEIADAKWTIDYAAFVAPVTVAGIQLSASVAYNKLTDLARAAWLNPLAWSWPVFLSGETNVDWQDLVITDYRRWGTGSIDVINLGFGTDITEDLAAGMSGNIYLGSSDEGYDVFAVWEDVPAAGGPEERTLRQFRAHMESDISTMGFNLTFGLQYRFDKLKLGAVAKTPFELVSDWDATQNDTVWEYDPIDGKDFVIASDVKNDFIVIDNKQKLEIPLTLAGGVSYQFTPEFLVSFDLEWRRFGRSNRLIQDSIYIRASGERDEFYTSSPLNYYNAGEGRLGFEYMLQTSSGSIPLRGGLRYVQHYLADVSKIRYSPIVEEETGVSIPTFFTRTDDGLFQVYWDEGVGDRISGYGFSVGTGIHWDRVWLDGMFEYYTDNRDLKGIDGLGPLTGEDKYDKAAVVIGFTGFF